MIMMTTTSQYHHNRNIYSTTSDSLSSSQQQMSNLLKQDKNQTSADAMLAAISSDIGSGFGDHQQQFQILLNENQRLSSIARLCIHLVDRCRNLNKSKQFIEDLSRLSNLIDDFNRLNTRKNSNLPTFTANAGVILTASPRNNAEQRNKASIHQNNGQSGGGNMYLIPIMGPPNQQGLQQFQLIQTNDGEVGNSFKSKGKKKLQQPSTLVQQQNMVQQYHQQQHQQSILFKKLTESGQLLDTSMLSGHHNPHHNLTVPINLANTSSCEQMFSILPQQQSSTNNQNILDHSNIENNPNLKQLSTTGDLINRSDNSNANNSQQKLFKCHICDKLFANAYNLNRHGKSHSGFQPYHCEYPDCSKRFNYKYHLKRHMETHTGARPFICTWPDCDQRFNRKYNLNRHLWIHAENKNKNQNGTNIIDNSTS